jgi:excisionase family DNA binding protein
MGEKLTLTIAETATALGVSRPTVYKLIHRDDFPSFRIGSRVVISRSGLEEWIAAQVRG